VHHPAINEQPFLFSLIFSFFKLITNLMGQLLQSAYIILLYLLLAGLQISLLLGSCFGTAGLVYLIWYDIKCIYEYGYVNSRAEVNLGLLA
jgi:hypothetical protein